MNWRCTAFVVFLASGFSWGAFSPAVVAAAPGAACCNDLQQRIDDLDETGVRHARGPLSLQIYGQVNRALLIWNDGTGRNAYVVDNDGSSSRVGVLGERRIAPGWYAGFRMELELKDAGSDEVSNVKVRDEGLHDDPRLRKSYLYLESGALGRVSLGQQSPATDDITIINLGARMSDAALHYNNGFAVKLDFGSMMTTDRSWGYFAHTVDSFRGDFLRYDSPSIHGFVLSAAAGEDDVWDVALRYAGDWGGVRIAAGAGYMNAAEHDFADLRGSFSALHMETGLFLSTAGGFRQDGFPAIGEGDGAHFYFAQLGIKRRVLPFGDMSIYGEFGNYSDYGAGRLIQATLDDPEIFTMWGRITESDVRRLGFGIEQSVDSAGLLLYAQYQLYRADLMGQACIRKSKYSYDFEEEAQALPVPDWSAVIVGARVQF